MALTHLPNKVAVEDDDGGTDPKRLLTVDQVAHRLQCTPQTVRDLVRRGSLRTVRLGTKMRFRPQWVEDFIERRAR